MSLYYVAVAVEAKEYLRALAIGQADWGRYGSSQEHRRYAVPNPRQRGKCSCGGGRASHLGAANGVALMRGCEMCVRRWVRDGC